MGRSRVVSRSVDDDGSQRSKRKRVPSAVEIVGSAPAGKMLSDTKGALYHCNYCNKDISGVVRVKCAVCPDFDLCAECFSVGAEVSPHKSNHAYRVMDNLSFPLIHRDWNVDEEVLLLEGIEMYGFGNWTEVGEHVGTKSRSQCIDHYNAMYMNSPCFPLPDMSHITGKRKEELIAMAKGHIKVKKEPLMGPEPSLKEESPTSIKVNYEVPRKEDPACQSSPSLSGDLSSHVGSSSGNTFFCANKKTNVAQIIESVKVEDSQADRTIGEKKPRVSMDEGPSMTELSGFNFKRQEFEVEYDNDAEQLLADMEFKDTDTDAEHEMKLRILHIYSKRLDERKRRKDFILERNLLYPDPFEKSLSAGEREIYWRYKVFMRFLSKEEHEELIKNVIQEFRIVKRLQELQDARAAGCRTSSEATRFVEEKQKKEAEHNAQRVKESGQAGPSDRTPVQGSPRGFVKGSSSLYPFSKEPSVPVLPFLSSLDDWDITEFTGADLLSDAEKQLCGEIKLLPSHYLNMLQTLSVEILKGNIAKKSDAHELFKVEAGKVDRVYDMLVRKGIARG